LACLFGEDATTKVVEDWITEKPRVLQKRGEQFLETIARGMWQAMEEKNSYILFCLDIEGLVEKAEE
jgi:hypothetical protein